jgi:hypothetical protein
MGAAAKRVSKSGYARALNDWYVEDRACVRGLLAAEKFEGVSWDPSCGGGNIPSVMRAHGLECLASDIVDRGFPGAEQIDFLAMSTSRVVDNIVCNPPYGKLIEPWIEKALSLATKKVAVIAPLSFLEGTKRGAGLWVKHPPARVLTSSRRISMPPGGTDVKPKGGKKAYAWFIWHQGHVGPYSGGWI